MCDIQLLCVSASWCGSCRMLKKTMDDKGIKYQVLDCDESPKEVETLNVEQLPTIIAYKGEKEIGRWVDDPKYGTFENWYLNIKKGTK